MDQTSLRAKGVNPQHSLPAVLPGWTLRFNVNHFFRHEGGVANIEFTGDPADKVLGLVHYCSDDALKLMDAVEAYGFGYDRTEILTETDRGTIQSVAYFGMSTFIDDECLPTQRYLNILLKGAKSAQLDSSYIDMLESHPVHEKRMYPVFRHPRESKVIFDVNTLAGEGKYTALAGAVFDMADSRWEHQYLIDLFGGKDMTLWHLKRLDTSDGTETLEHIKQDRLNDYQRQYLNEYLNEYNDEYKYVGHYRYD